MRQGFGKASISSLILDAFLMKLATLNAVILSLHCSVSMKSIASLLLKYRVLINAQTLRKAIIAITAIHKVKNQFQEAPSTAQSTHNV